MKMLRRCDALRARTIGHDGQRSPSAPTATNPVRGKRHDFVPGAEVSVRASRSPPGYTRTVTPGNQHAQCIRFASPATARHAAKQNRPRRELLIAEVVGRGHRAGLLGAQRSPRAAPKGAGRCSGPPPPGGFAGRVVSGRTYGGPPSTCSRLRGGGSGNSGRFQRSPRGHGARSRAIHADRARSAASARYSFPCRVLPRDGPRVASRRRRRDM